MTLQPFERRWVAIVARALVPPGALAAAGITLGDVDMGARYAEECRVSPWHVALLLRASLWLTWLSPLWLSGRPRTFGGVDDAARVALLERLLDDARYPVRMAGMFLKLTLCTLLLGDAATLAQLGAYDLAPPQPRGSDASTAVAASALSKRA